jgi:predicted ATP-grasp superfamily ATP-dependent carboligase
MARGYTALGTLRSLVQAGIPSYVICPLDDLCTRSRWYRSPPGADGWHGEIDEHTTVHLDAITLEQAVLIPGADDAALWVADLAGTKQAKRFHASSSTRETLLILQNKQRFGQFLSDASLPHPRTFTLDTQADVSAVPFDDLDRVFVKPMDSQHFNNTLGKKGIWARDRDELTRVWDELHAMGLGVIAQEYVPGTSADHYFIDGFRDRLGNVTGAMARRRLRIYPPDFGNSSYCETVALNDVSGAYETLLDLLSQLNYRGIFSAEFKRDSRNGIFRILEVNTRAWWYVEFAARCGVNVCAMAYEDALETPVTMAAPVYSVGAGCVNWINDAKSVLPPAGRRGESWLNILRQWSHACFHVLRIGDLRPGVHVIGDTLIQQIRRIVQIRR